MVLPAGTRKCCSALPDNTRVLPGITTVLPCVAARCRSEQFRLSESCGQLRVAPLITAQNILTDVLDSNRGSLESFKDKEY